MEFITPFLVVILRYPLQIPENVGITDGMSTGIPEIWGPAVMNHSAVELREYSDSIHRFRSSFQMMSIQGKAISTGGMQPLPFSLHSQSGFVCTKNRSFREQMLDLILKFLKIRCTI